MPSSLHSFIHLVAHLQLVAAADCAGALDVIDDLQNLLVSYGTCLAWSHTMHWWYIIWIFNYTMTICIQIIILFFLLSYHRNMLHKSLMLWWSINILSCQSGYWWTCWALLLSPYSRSAGDIIRFSEQVCCDEVSYIQILSRMHMFTIERPLDCMNICRLLLTCKHMCLCALSLQHTLWILLQKLWIISKLRINRLVLERAKKCFSFCVLSQREQMDFILSYCFDLFEWAFICWTIK